MCIHHRGRAWRRHQYARLKVARRAYWVGPNLQPPTPQWEARRLGMLARTPKINQCWCCSSPRRLYGNAHQGRTFQERRAALAEREGWSETVHPSVDQMCYTG